LPFYDPWNEKGTNFDQLKDYIYPKRRKGHKKTCEVAWQETSGTKAFVIVTVAEMSLLWRRDKFDQLSWYSLSNKREYFFSIKN